MIMYEYGPQHPLSYRQEVLTPLFERIRVGESCVVVGPASMGKTRLLDFMMRPDVQDHYLGKQSGETIILRADCNRMAQANEWGLFEMMLTALVEGSDQRPRSRNYQKQLNDLREPVILRENALLANRHLELAARSLIKEAGMKLCYVMDEFDETYRRFPALALAKLRALRDQYKNRLCYVLLMRNIPERIRDPEDSESFYELFSRWVIGLGPYNDDDAARIEAQLEDRRQHNFPMQIKTNLLRMAGGHAGMIGALMDILTKHPEWGLDQANLTQLAEQPAILEECRKLWEGLPEEEHYGLANLQRGASIPENIRTRLGLKGLVKTDGAAARIIPPLFGEYIRKFGPSAPGQVWLDESAHTIQVEGRIIKNLTALEFKLAAFLYHHIGQICRCDEIHEQLFPNEPAFTNESNTRIDTLVRQLRDSIELDPSHPRYLIAVRDVGYKLAATAEG